MTLTELNEAANHAEAEFDTACRSAGYGDRWAAYRADMRGAVWPFALIEADKAYTQALHAFYLARDGERGVLGSRGL